ncbi:MAG: protoheme IX farnesyltransferase [Bacteroidetes bacterium RIFCSPLOWO2_02_FULL_36_8]|nr:MAG: protoheme IX farnesyltransferase [Bacteroidetes bacterium RIFCSPLOWO2_02_FULL_36_8]OFY70299.1 MAG: protoheme IX farnesyltransferase [Bacteroidetes bacterium RIFCSPLOWO2_12_FULL_37_12]
MNPITLTGSISLRQQLIDYKNFIKLRLTFLVVFSAGFGYMYGMKDKFIQWNQFLTFLVGGFLITAASNGINQIIESDLDKLMLRTSDRGLPSGRMSFVRAYILVFLMAIAGILLLWDFGILTCVLSITALLFYAFIYTPVKKISSFATLLGAFPGAVPPLLGMIAATGSFSRDAFILFLIQFIWQFPHFWSIAWVFDEDYNKAGFKVLPAGSGKSKANALQICIYTFLLLPISFIPLYYGMCDTTTTMLIFFAGIIFFIQSLILFKKLSPKAGYRLMFGSFFYLPLIQIFLYVGR